MSGEVYDLYSEFDAEKHKKKYIDYLEVVIDEHGKVMYAVPSHQEKAISIACGKWGVTREELNAMCPPEYYFDFLRWLCMMSNVVFVWNGYCVAENANKKQVSALRDLKLAGLYKGTIPEISKIGGKKTKE